VTTLAFIFPGQGSQYVGMGQALAEAFPRAAEVFDEANRALDEPLSRLTWTGDAGELDQTVNAQPALLATSVAYLRALESALDGRAPMPQPAFYAGHSMGQYSALVAAGALSLADGVRLVRERGRQMQASAEDGAMAAVIGLPDDQLDQLRTAGSQAGPFAIANRNAPGQVVISGSRAAVEAASQVAPGLGARRVIPLPVSVAAHSSLMTRAAERMREVLSEVEFRDPSAPLLANADARPLATAEACREELIEHLTQGVDWVAAVSAMTDAGVTTFVEVGPGKVLTGLVKRIAPEAAAIPLDEPDAPGRLAVPDLSPTTAAPA
jgi:[acyl-carrier-protein] S-malonyltransferase